MLSTGRSQNIMNLENASCLLSTSPTSVNEFEINKRLMLDDFLKELPHTIESILESRESLRPQEDESKADPIAELFRCVEYPRYVQSRRWENLIFSFSQNPFHLSAPMPCTQAPPSFSRGIVSPRVFRHFQALHSEPSCNR